MSKKESTEEHVKSIRRATRKQYSSEEKKSLKTKKDRADRQYRKGDNQSTPPLGSIKDRIIGAARIRLFGIGAMVLGLLGMVWLGDDGARCKGDPKVGKRHSGMTPSAAPELTTRHWSIPVLIVLVVAAAYLRAVAVVETRVSEPLRGDAVDYVSYAVNIAAHGVYSRDRSSLPAPAPDALRAPGYPLALYALLDPKLQLEKFIEHVKWAQVGLSLITLVLGYLVTRHLAGHVAALFVATFVAISPHLINMNCYLLSETLFAFELMLFVGCLVLAFRSRAPWPWLFVGLLLGVCALTRPFIQYFPIVLAVFILRRGPAGREIKVVALLLGGFAVVFAPWVIRNVVSVGAAGDPTLMINGLHHGMYPGFMHESLLESFGYPYRYDPRVSQFTSSVGQVLGEIYLRFESDPSAYLLWYLVGKPLSLFSWTNVQGFGEIFVYPVSASPYFGDATFILLADSSRMFHSALMVLASLTALLNLMFAPRRREADSRTEALVALSLLFAYFVAVHMITTPFPRYAIPLRPLCFILAVCGAQRISRRLFSRLSGKSN